nr:hypothetical protein GCM10020093_117410 [Planobispora longispora]
MSREETVVPKESGKAFWEERYRGHTAIRRGRPRPGRRPGGPDPAARVPGAPMYPAVPRPPPTSTRTRPGPATCWRSTPRGRRRRCGTGRWNGAAGARPRDSDHWKLTDTLARTALELSRPPAENWMPPADEEEEVDARTAALARARTRARMERATRAAEGPRGGRPRP